MSKSQEILDFLSQDKYAEAKDVLRAVVKDNVTSRVQAKQSELGLTTPVKAE